MGPMVVFCDHGSETSQERPCTMELTCYNTSLNLES